MIKITTYLLTFLLFIIVLFDVYFIYINSYLYETIIKFTSANIYGIIGLFAFHYLVINVVYNFIIRRRYKREINGNDKKYIALRCYEDGYSHDRKNGTVSNEDKYRDYFYLVEVDKKKYHRIVDTYTLQQLGYPRPSRNEDKCFKIADGYILAEEIKIYNLLSEISEVSKFKDIDKYSK